MNFGRTDLLIITSMSLAVILMSFAMPALGLTDESDEAEESDLPEFDMDASRFDFAGDFPASPNPSEGQLIRDENRTDEFSDNRIDFLHGDRQDGVRLNANGQQNQENVTVALQSMSGGGIDSSDQITLRNVSETKEIQNDTLEYTVHVTFTELENGGTADAKWTIDYEIIERPEDVGFLGGIPLVGSLLSTGELLAQTVMWVGSVIFWFFGAGIEVSLNVLGMFFDVATYGVDLMSFMIDTWQSILSAASGFAAVFILIPVVLLFLEFIKIIMIGISLLPFT